MARISSSISGIDRTLLNQLAKANAAIAMSTLRKASGHKINSPADDPSAFIALSQLQGQLTGVSKAMVNASAAGNMLSQADTAMASVGEQLQTIRDQLLLDEGGTLTPDQRAAAQAGIDQAISRINGLAETQIGGRRILSGTADYSIANRNADQVSRVEVFASPGGQQTLHANVGQAAAQATLEYTGTLANKISAAAEITLGGSSGSVELTFAAGQTLESAAAAINQQSHKTGVVATVDATNHTLTLESVGYGSAAKTAVAVDSGSFIVAGGDGNGTDYGTDAQATINGIAYTGQGNHFDFNENGLRLSMDLAPGFSGQTSTMTVSGDALRFALSPELAITSSVAIGDLHAASLGGLSGSLDELSSGGALSGLAANTSRALRVVDEAIGRVAIARANIGGFQRATVESASNLLSDLEENLTSAMDGIDKVNDDEEDALISYNRALASNAVGSLSILNDQRMMVVKLIQNIAGLN